MKPGCFVCQSQTVLGLTDNVAFGFFCNFTYSLKDVKEVNWCLYSLHVTWSHMESISRAPENSWKLSVSISTCLSSHCPQRRGVSRTSGPRKPSFPFWDRHPAWCLRTGRVTSIKPTSISAHSKPAFSLYLRKSYQGERAGSGEGRGEISKAQSYKKLIITMQEHPTGFPASRGGNEFTSHGRHNALRTPLIFKVSKIREKEGRKEEEKADYDQKGWEKGKSCIIKVRFSYYLQWNMTKYYVLH